MVFFVKSHLITFSLEVGRVTVDEGIVTVVLANEIFKILVFNDNIRQPAGAFPDKVEETADITRLAAEGLSAAAEAVTDHLEIICRTADIPTGRSFQHQRADRVGIRRLQKYLSQFHFFPKIILCELVPTEKLIQHIEIVTGVQRQKSKFFQQGHGAVFNTAEQIGKIAVKVVVDLHTPRLDRTVYRHCAAAAEYINESVIAFWSQFIEYPQQLALASHPGDEAFQSVSPPSRGKVI